MNQERFVCGTCKRAYRRSQIQTLFDDHFGELAGKQQYVINYEKGDYCFFCRSRSRHDILSERWANISGDVLSKDLQYIVSLYEALIRSVGHRESVQNYMKNISFLKFIAEKHHGKDFMMNLSDRFDRQRKEFFQEIFDNSKLFDKSHLD